MRGSLVFGAATSDRVDFGSPAALDDLNPFTYLLWVFPTTFTAGRRLAAKGAVKSFNLSGTGGAMQVVVARTANTSYITNTNPLSLNAWNMVAATFDSAAGAGQIVNIYRGTLAAAPTECGYGTATDGSGTPTSDAADNFFLGNNSALNVALQGRIAVAAVFGVVLSLGDITSWWRTPRKTIGANVGKLFSRLGKDGADAIEYTGLTGTVTGATQGDGAPLEQPWTRDLQSGLYLRAS